MTWELTPDLEHKILSQLEDGISLVKICAADDMPSRGTVLNWQRENDDFCTKCARAREACGDLAADALDDINDKVEKQILEPAAANVISSNLKWKASKLAPKKYGDRLQTENRNVDKDGNDIIPKSDNELNTRLAELLNKK